MKFRTAVMFVGAAALLAAGCGSDDDKSDSKDSDAKKVESLTAEEKDDSKDVSAKKKNVSEAQKAFDKDSTNPDVCRDLANKLIALASPESTGDPKKPPTPPENREEVLEQASETLETCVDLAPKDTSIKQMLASTYMGLNQYDEAQPILKSIAEENKDDANAYYSWGLAASNAGDQDTAIIAWKQFIAKADAKDPRIKQIRQSIEALEQSKKSTAKSGGAKQQAGGEETEPASAEPDTTEDE